MYGDSFIFIDFDWLIFRDRHALSINRCRSLQDRIEWTQTAFLYSFSYSKQHTQDFFLFTDTCTQYIHQLMTSNAICVYCVNLSPDTVWTRKKKCLCVCVCVFCLPYEVRTRKKGHSHPFDSILWWTASNEWCTKKTDTSCAKCRI